MMSIKVVTMFMVFMILTVSFSTARELPFPFGTVAGDIFTRPNDDGSSIALTLPFEMKYLGDSVTSVYQNTNGDITFDAPFSRFTPSLIPSNDVPAMVAIFWGDIDTRNGGTGQNELWIRTSEDPNDLNVARNIIAGTGQSFMPQAVIVATWNKVEAFSMRIGAQNTFQCTMAYDQSGTTWVILAYTQLEFFETGTSVEAVVGFNDRPGLLGELITVVDNFNDLGLLLSGTNCNSTGVYAYQVDQGIELSGCGSLVEECVITPFQGPVEGGTTVQFKNLPQCLDNNTVAVYCKFDSPGFLAVAPGVRVSREAVECLSPYVGVAMTSQVAYAVANSSDAFNPDTAVWITASNIFQFLGRRPGLTFSNADPDEQTTVLEADDPVGITIQWNETDLRQDAFESLTRIVADEVVTLDAIAFTIEILALVNDEQQVFDVVKMIPVALGQEEATIVVSATSLLGYYITVNTGTVALVLVRVIAGFRGRVGTTRTLGVIGVLAPGQSPDGRWLGLLCDSFLTPKEDCPGLDELPPCPPTQGQVGPNGNFMDDVACTFPNGGCNFFHGSAAGCYRAHGPGRTGQQCCYSARGGLITNPNQGAGTADCIAGDGSVANSIGHFLKDVLPYIVCCKFTDSCDDYYEERPADDGSGYIPPRPPARASGDPHLQTIDGLAYNFNGAGEFVAFCSLPAGDLFAACNPSQQRLVTGQAGALSLHLRFAPLGLGTITVGVAIQDPLHREGLFSIVIVPHPSRRIDFFDGDTLVPFPSTIAGQSTVTVLLSSGAMISRSADLSATTIKVKVFTPSGLVLTLSEIGGVMLPAVAAPSSLVGGRAVGLFGFVDDDVSNDLTDSDGNIVTIDGNLSQAEQEAVIFNGFGSTWMIRTLGASLFQSLESSDQSFGTFFNPTFVPAFEAPALDDTLQQAADTACAGIQSDIIRQGCYFDIAVTGDPETFGAVARAAEEQQRVVDNVLNSPPSFNSSSVSIQLNTNETGNVTFAATDMNADNITFSLERNDNNAFQLEVSVTNREGFVRFLGSPVPGRFVGWVGASDGLGQTIFAIAVDVVQATARPTARPTVRPTANPTKRPTANPTKRPTANPTKRPTANPTKRPTANPTVKPTAKPTKAPVRSNQPTAEPTAKPTRAPVRSSKPAGSDPMGSNKPTGAPANTKCTIGVLCFVRRLLDRIFDILTFWN